MIFNQFLHLQMHLCCIRIKKKFFCTPTGLLAASSALCPSYTITIDAYLACESAKSEFLNANETRTRERE